MNIFYYPVILIDNIELIFLILNDLFFYCLTALFVLTAVVLPVLIVLAKKGKIGENIVFYTVLSFICLILSLSFIWFISIPLVIYFTQLLTYVFNNSNKIRIKKKISRIISIFFVCFIIIINLIYFYTVWLWGA